jgi:hypothetical protein
MRRSGASRRSALFRHRRVVLDVFPRLDEGVLDGLQDSGPSVGQKTTVKHLRQARRELEKWWVLDDQRTDAARGPFSELCGFLNRAVIEGVVCDAKEVDELGGLLEDLEWDLGVTH